MQFTAALISCSALFLLPTPASSIPTNLEARALKFDYGGTKVRGVNLGGWLVTEPWITPSLYDALNGAAVDEFTFCATLGQQEALNRLGNHWNTFITQGDLNAIAGAGLNHVRIPIGYWSILPIQGEPFVQGAYEYLGRALGWAQAAGLKVIIDLHGAAGSQNGFDNSGRRDAINWDKGGSIGHTLAVLSKLRDDYAGHPAVASIELLNEPLGGVISLDTIRQFYSDGWGTLRSSNVAVTFHDAFQSPPSWNSWGNGLSNLVLDTHHYEVFDPNQLKLDINGHVGAACAFGRQMASANKPTIAGEWTGAMTDCAHWLNGYGRGARYDSSYQSAPYAGDCSPWIRGSIASLPDAQKQATRRFIEAQLDAYEFAAGWVFWTWKTEGAPGWDMQDLLRNGIFPQPVTARNYPGQCG